MQGEFTGLAHPVWSTPSGYGSPTNRRAFVEFAAGRAINPRGNTSFEQQIGRPAHHRRHARRRWSPSCSASSRRRGPASWRCGATTARVSQEDSLTCIRLIGQEVFPAIREIAKELDLKSPFEGERAGPSAATRPT